MYTTVGCFFFKTVTNFRMTSSSTTTDNYNDDKDKV